MRPSTWGRGYWLGTVADNGDTIFTVAKFDKTDGDPADGAKPTASESTAMPLYRWEPYGRTIEIGGLRSSFSSRRLHH